MISLVNSRIIGQLRELHKVTRIKHLAQILGNSGVFVLDFLGNPQEGGEGQRVSHSCERAARSRGNPTKTPESSQGPCITGPPPSPHRTQLQSPGSTVVLFRTQEHPKFHLRCIFTAASWQNPHHSALQNCLLTPLCAKCLLGLHEAALESWCPGEGGDTSHPEDVVTYGGEETQGHHAAPAGHEARLRACLPILQRAGKVNPDRGMDSQSAGKSVSFYCQSSKCVLQRQ